MTINARRIPRLDHLQQGTVANSTREIQKEHMSMRKKSNVQIHQCYYIGFFAVLMNIGLSSASVCMAETRICYWPVNENKTWHDALSICESQNGTLSVVDSRQTAYFFSSHALLNPGGIWVGLSDTITNGVHRWTNGRAMDLQWTSMWEDMKPDNLSEDEDCVLWEYQTFKFNDISCSTKKTFVCQSIPFGFYCSSSEADCDSRVEKERYIELHTLEVEDGTWIQAKVTCEREGFRLLMIKSENENNQVGSQPTWIGLRDEGREGAYSWYDGNFSTYENWALGEPQGGTSLNCAFRLANGQWKSAQCSDKRPFICESVVKTDYCVNVTCSHRGVCQNDYRTDTYNCICEKGFAGKDCEWDVRRANAPCTTRILEETRACYWAGWERKPWQDALTTCVRENGTLAVVDSLEIFIALRQYNFVGDGGKWIGLSDGATNGVHRWTNGRVISWAPTSTISWAPTWKGQNPDNLSEDEDCVVLLHPEYSFDDIPCTTPKGFICQSIAADFYCLPSETDCAPWIHDGHYKEMTSKGLNLLTPTCTGNVLNTVDAEITNPSKCHEDLCQRATHYICLGSQWIDKSCRNTDVDIDRLNSAGCLVPSTGNFYLHRYMEEERRPVELHKLNLSSGTWEEAKAACEQEGFRLLMVKSKSEDNRIGPPTWIGLRDEGREGAYSWYDETFSTYENWAPGEPHGGRLLNCAFRSANGQWKSADCSDSKPFMCEGDIDHCKNVSCSNHGECKSYFKGDTYRCICEEGFVGRNCEWDIRKATLLFIYVTVTIKEPYLPIYADKHIQQTKEFISPLHSEIVESLILLVNGLEFVNIAQLTIEEGRFIARVEIGIESSPDEFSPAKTKQDVHDAIKEVVSDGKLGDIKVDPDSFTVRDPVRDKDFCASGPCKVGQGCISRKRGYRCVQSPGQTTIKTATTTENTQQQIHETDGQMRQRSWTHTIIAALFVLTVI